MVEIMVTADMGMVAMGMETDGQTERGGAIMERDGVRIGGAQDTHIMDTPTLMPILTEVMAIPIIQDITIIHIMEAIPILITVSIIHILTPSLIYGLGIN